jgi:poly(3-hydroxybutyrate) depolymerase
MRHEPGGDWIARLDEQEFTARDLASQRTRVLFHRMQGKTMKNVLSAMALLLVCLVQSVVVTGQIPDEQVGRSVGHAWITSKVAAPRVSFHTFESAAAKTRVSYHLYTPDIYEREKERRFPVVYWLHGSRGGLAGIPRVAGLFDEAIRAGLTPPCLVVFVNGLAEGMYVDWKDGTAPVETVIVRELVPHVDAAYRTVSAREGRLLDGYSMGGYGAARLGFKFPELFRGISIMGGGPLQAELIQAPRAGRQRAAEVLQQVYGGDQEYFKSVSPRRLAEQNAEAISRGSVIRQVCGDQDETFEVNREFHEHLQRLKIPHAWMVLGGVDHDPLATLQKLGDGNWSFYREAFGGAAATGTSIKQADFELSFTVGGQQRRALVVNAPVDGTKRPAVIVLHGGMGSAVVMRANSGFDRVARAEGFMVVYAEGTSFAGDERHAWNTGYLLRRQVQDADDIACLDMLIDRLTGEHGADAERIFMTGGSNGGMMTFVYAVARAERLAAIAPVVAAMFTFDQRPAVPLPILMISGAKDEEVPVEGGMSRNPLVRRAQEAPFKSLSETVQFWVESNRSVSQAKVNHQGTLTTTTHEAGANGAVTISLMDSVGGHGWPGSRARRPGNQPIMTFSGAERIWEFFRDKRREQRE